MSVILQVTSRYSFGFTFLTTLCFILFTSLGCVTTSPKGAAGQSSSQTPPPSSPSASQATVPSVAASPANSQHADAESSAAAAAESQQQGMPQTLPPDLCKPFSHTEFKTPYFIAQGPAVVTKLVNDCVTRLGERGYTKDLAWIAMGFPCTAGSGKITIKGNYYAPKMISFIVATDCPMAANTSDFAQVVQRATGIPQTASMLAFNPFSVQYWEIPSSGDADTGFAVELRTSLGVKQIWRDLRREETLAVRMYGRENAWVQGNVIYEVDAELRMAGRLGFQLNILNVKKLSAKEVEEVKDRCSRHVAKSACQSAL